MKLERLAQWVIILGVPAGVVILFVLSNKIGATLDLVNGEGRAISSLFGK